MMAAGHSSREQARLWLTAFLVSAALNGLLLVGFAWNVLADIVFMPSARSERLAAALKPAETVATIVPDFSPVVPAPEAAPETPTPVPPPSQGSSFARTSIDQESERPENPAFIGERNTRATSDLAPEENAPAMPSQQGEETDDEGDRETTVSRYQDGDLFHDTIARPNAPRAAQELPVGPDSPEPMQQQAASAPAASEPPPPPLADDLVQGPFPVEREVKGAMPPEEVKPPDPVEPPPDEKKADTEVPDELPKSPEEKEGTAEKDKPGKETPPTRPASSPQATQPGFRGYQYKHRIHGSISRQGRSALDVEDSVMGRYHAALSRAVEREWQLNCIRNRDYITPGQIIVRFVLEANGKVRSIQFVEEFGVGNIQKGFTSESIRSAEIPPFPAEMKKQLGTEPLEVTYSFTF